jgi:hypothetical protein
MMTMHEMKINCVATCYYENYGPNGLTAEQSELAARRAGETVQADSSQIATGLIDGRNRVANWVA